MSEENVEAQRHLQDAAVRGDYQPSVEALDEDVELWVDPRTNPDAGEFRGRTAVISWWTDFVASFEDYWVEPGELIDAGDWVVVTSRSGGRGRESGAIVERDWVNSFKWRDGRPPVGSALVLLMPADVDSRHYWERSRNAQGGTGDRGDAHYYGARGRAVDGPR